MSPLSVEGSVGRPWYQRVRSTQAAKNGAARPASSVGVVLLVTGGGPTEDKPTVTFAAPADPDGVSHAMTIRVPDCQAAYETLRGRGAVFLMPPHDWGREVRCFFRDPDGHLFEISEAR
jgi:catechol 2,3-dioxygenase-like lactoylglutathione lyase family enzyme